MFDVASKMFLAVPRAHREKVKRALLPLETKHCKDTFFSLRPLFVSYREEKEGKSAKQSSFKTARKEKAGEGWKMVEATIFILYATLAALSSEFSRYVE